MRRRSPPVRKDCGHARGINLCRCHGPGLRHPFFGILITPIRASAAMSLSSLSVVENSLRLRRTGLRHWGDGQPARGGLQGCGGVTLKVVQGSGAGCHEGLCHTQPRRREEDP